MRNEILECTIERPGNSKSMLRALDCGTPGRETRVNVTGAIKCGFTVRRARHAAESTENSSS